MVMQIALYVGFMFYGILLGIPLGAVFLYSWSLWQFKSKTWGTDKEFKAMFGNG